MALRDENMPGTAVTKIRVKWYRSAVFRFSVLNMMVILVLVGGVIFRGHQRDKQQLVKRFGSVLKTVSANGAVDIDGAKLAQINDNEDAKGAAFVAARGVLERLRDVNGLANDAVYILRPSVDDPATYRFVVMLQDKTFIGDGYKPPKDIRALYEEALNDGKALALPLFEDDHGSFISGIAPIKDDDGRYVALLQADIRLAEYVAQLREETRTLVAFALGMAFLVLLLTMLLRKKLAQGLGELMRGTNALNDENFDVRVELNSEDELEQLAKSINRALEHLQQRSEMLKFLPDHTQKMIARVLNRGSGSVDLTEGRDVEVAILESDIRGFTALSERLAPSETIALINDYIRIQAEVVLTYNGSIDKYMGDAVLVVFEGEDAVERAVRCGREILIRVAEMNRTSEEPVRIGVGISHGHVVMGNMGCESRMEHTVIGPTVNLAARLCGVAQGGELVMPYAVFKTVEHIGLCQANSDVTTTTASNEVVVKGFSDPIRIVSIRCGIDDA